MKTAIRIVLTLTMASLFGCHMSPRGGSMVENQGFKIAAPTFTTEVKQGQVQMVTVSLHRDSLFKQDVKLQVTASKGISVEPTSVTIKANETPEVQFQIAAPKDAALGEYPVVVKGTPETGAPTSIGFTVKVVSQ